jgi:dTDP-4-dehydrorhamnose 3,5-epimerase
LKTFVTKIDKNAYFYSKKLKMTSSIMGVKIKPLKTHRDDRGYFREIIRSTDHFFEDGFGQLSHSLVYSGVVKAWHGHSVQSQWTYAAVGTLKVVLHDIRKDSPTYKETMEFLVGDNTETTVYHFPPGVAHGYKCINGPAHIIYVTSGQYDLKDEVRIPHDSPEIRYEWGAGSVFK